MSDYPETISLEGEKLALLRQHSQLIENLYENQGFQGPLELSADLLFDFKDKETKQEKWELFYDLFFPEEGAGKLFNIRGNTLLVKESRGGEEALREMLDYMMVDSPKTMMNFAREQARKRINAPSEIVSTAPRAKGKTHYRPMTKANRNRLYLLNIENNNNDYYNYNNNNNNNNNSINIGYTEEEESAMGKMSGTNIRRYFPKKRRNTRRNHGNSRKTRRNRK